ncbi:hypothetical protein PMAYCL1PPCAC_30612, partial [Pristionchus mayeri]
QSSISFIALLLVSVTAIVASGVSSISSIASMPSVSSVTVSVRSVSVGSVTVMVSVVAGHVGSVVVAARVAGRMRTVVVAATGLSMGAAARLLGLASALALVEFAEEGEVLAASLRARAGSRAATASLRSQLNLLNFGLSHFLLCGRSTILCPFGYSNKILGFFLKKSDPSLDGMPSICGEVGRSKGEEGEK